ncbi:Glycosyl transferase family 2 [Pseudovibrio sp. W64]|uniref:glycosyltransferase family 2 protein n=1 Tax=Pseudovibrio sp. W64 TaxID=1735583 RepID=UPI0007AECB35|nr:glycosyltransferase [Pseudovibrio sp. W64]KZK87650.1 Glycosyl transferase family 2 [Pseudovibrio sp. W64]
MQINRKIEDQVSIIVKTFERPDLIKRCVHSIRALHPRLPVIVADDSQETVRFENDPHTTVLSLPYDSGISWGRNRALEQVVTPYYILIDDDHCFEADSNIDGLIRVLEGTDMDIVAMRMIDYRNGKRYSRGELVFAGTMDIEGGVFRHKVGANRGYHADHPLYDLVLNCYIAKKSSTSDLTFDENIKIGKEHGDYFLQAKSKGLKITVAKDAYIHHRPVYSDAYNKFRKRSDDYSTYFFNKHGIESEEIIGSHYFIENKVRHYGSRLLSFFKKV